MSFEAHPARGRGNRGRNAVTLLALTGDDASRAAIMAALAQIPEPVVEVVELGGPTSDARAPEVVIVALGDDPGTWPLEVQELKQGLERRAIIGALAPRASGQVRQALRAGVDDVFFLPVEPTDLARCLVRVCESLEGGGAHRAVICALTSVAGGVGVSSLTTALGFSLARQAGQRVALLDLGLQCGALAALLDLNPENTISELVDPTSSIDSLRLESSLVAHPAGVYLLAAPKRIEESEMVTVSTVVAVLEVMRELFDFVLIDCGHHMNEALIAAWEHATHLLYVVEQSISSVRPAQRFLEMFERLQLGELDLRFVLNRYDPASLFTADKIEAALRRPLATRIPRDDAAFMQLQLESADLARVAAKSPSRIAIDQLAADLSGFDRAAAAAATRPFFARMRAALKLPGTPLLSPAPLRRGAKPSAADV